MRHPEVQTLRAASLYCIHIFFYARFAMKKEQRYSRNAWVRLIVIAAIALFMIAQVKTVKVSREAQGRSGPGSFYELKVLIPSGKLLPVIEVKKSWYKVRYGDQEVWVSENCLLNDKSSSSGTFENMALDDAAVKASPAAISAAIKGFWVRYSHSARDSLTSLPVEGYAIPEAAIETFVRERTATVNRESLLGKYPVRNPYKPGMTSFVREQSIGYAIASKAADAPLSTPQVQALAGTPASGSPAVQYVNSVGMYLALGTERSDIPFKFLILNTDRVNAVSCPGGYILLTRGLLKLVGDESELAALLAHEMAHVIAGHGMKEILENKVQITAGDAFASLDSETKSDSADYGELAGIIDRAVSMANSPRLDTYEFEADRKAIEYLARSGYDLKGHLRLLTSLKTKFDDNIDIFDLSYRNHPDFPKRFSLSENEIKGYRSYTGRTFAENFKAGMVF